MRTAGLLFAFVLTLHADFNAGVRAYQSQDYSAAMTEWRPIAEKGDAQAEYNLGVMYAMGQGVEKDPAQAVAWYTKAAEQGVREAEFNLGVLYCEGEGLPPDLPQAEKWLKQAAESGDKKAANALADLYADRIHNDAEARKWYEKASQDSNSAKAEFDLGVIFDLGKGVPADRAEADKWYRKAAEQGYGPALTNVGILYYNGQGVKRDLVLAHEYFLLGEKGGDPRATELAGWTAAKLSKKQLKRATDLAHDWESAHSTPSVSGTN